MTASSLILSKLERAAAESEQAAADLLTRLTHEEFHALLLYKAQELSKQGETSRSALYLDSVIRIETRPLMSQSTAPHPVAAPEPVAAPRTASPRMALFYEAETSQQPVATRFDIRKVADVLTADRPIVRPMKSYPDESEGSTSERQEVLSETLGEILLQQKKYSEARKVFIHLARIHPERIEEFKNRIADIDAREAQGQ